MDTQLNKYRKIITEVYGATPKPTVADRIAAKKDIPRLSIFRASELLQEYQTEMVKLMRYSKKILTDLEYESSEVRKITLKGEQSWLPTITMQLDNRNEGELGRAEITMQDTIYELKDYLRSIGEK